MTIKNIHFRESYIDQVTDRAMEPGVEGGHLISELWIKCSNPKCGDENVLAFWQERGGKGVGSLTCNKCGKPLLSPETTPEEEAYFKGLDSVMAESGALVKKEEKPASPAKLGPPDGKGPDPKEMQAL